MATPTSPKVKAGAVGGGAAGALAVLVVSILDRNGVALSEVEAGALTVLVTTGAASLAAWWKTDPLRSSSNR